MRQKQKQKQTQRQTVVVNIGEQKRKRATRKRKPAPPPQPKVIQQFIPQFAPSFDMGGIQRLIQSEIRMLEPPRLGRLEDIEREREEMRRERLILGEQQEQAQRARNFFLQHSEQMIMENSPVEEDIELIKAQNRLDSIPIASTSNLQPISTDKQPLINQSLGAPIRLPDDSPSPVLSLDNRPMEEAQAQQILKKNKYRSMSLPPLEKKTVSKKTLEQFKEELKEQQPPKRGRGRPPKEEGTTVREQKAKARKERRDELIRQTMEEQL